MIKWSEPHAVVDLKMYYSEIVRCQFAGTNIHTPHGKRYPCWLVVCSRADGKWYATHRDVAGAKHDKGPFDDIEDAKRLAETLSIVHPQVPE